MPITVMCRGCEKRYQVKDEYAGKKIRCPGCSSVLSVRAQRPKVDEYEDYGDIPEETDDDFGDEPRALPEPRRRRKQERRPERTRSVSRGRINFGPWILAGVGFAAVAGLVVVCLLFPPVIIAFGLLMIFAGFATILVGGVGCIVRAFQEDTLCGLMYLFVPFYGLYFIITRWNDVQPFGICLFGGLATIVLTVVSMGGMMALSQSTGFSSSFGGRSSVGRAASQPPGIAGIPPQVNTPPSIPWPPRQTAPQPRHPFPTTIPQAPERFAPQPTPQFPGTIPQPGGAPFQPPIPGLPNQDTRGHITLSETEAQTRTSLTPASHVFAVKDRVYIHWGGKWYECEVLEVSGGGDPKIHWIGWSSSWDEVIVRDRIRIPRKK